MKTLEKLYEEIQADAELRKEYVKAAEDKKVIDFLKAHDCDATEAEVESFVKAKNEKNKELSDDELDNISGGGCTTTYTGRGWPVVSICNSCSHYEYSGANGEADNGLCCSCRYSKTNEDWLLICYCPQRHESVDDI